MTFYRYMMDYLKAKPPEGAIKDLAYDVSRDPEFPRKARRHDTLFNYLSRQGACPEAIDTFELSYLEYLKGGEDHDTG